MNTRPRPASRRESRQPWLAGAAGAALLLGLALTGEVRSQAESVVDTVHNLSVSGPGRIRAVTETEVCKFCHIPHNALVPVPLWGHALSREQYSVPEVRAGRGARQPAPQPDGDSRLCLSCHDGTVALGKVVSEPAPIAMSGRGRLSPGDRGYLGTDLTGSHPISFELVDTVEVEVAAEATDMVTRPLSEIRSNPLVRIDANNKMQCTTCHDAHSDRHYVPGEVPRFWVTTSVDAVCVSCHVLR